MDEEGTTTTNIPIYVDIQVDQLYLRPVEVEIDKGSGGNPIPIGVTQSGNTSIPIYSHIIQNLHSALLMNIRKQYR